jgi:glutamate racemase
MRFLLLLLFVLPVSAVDLVTQAPGNGKTAFTFDKNAWSTDETARRLPIGVFDSGIGGLTVMEAILKLDAFHNDTLAPGADGVPDFADERFIYFGDQANMPYGNYSAAGRTDYLRELILKDAVFLLGRRVGGAEPRFDKPPVKAIVIACNTATAYGLEDIRQAIAAWKLPVIVVGLAGRSVPLIAQQGSATLAGAIEGDSAFPEPVSSYALKEARSLAEAYLALKPSKPLETIVLGCTHYPLVEAEIDAAFAQIRTEPAWKEVIAEKRKFVNPAQLTARELFRELALAKLRLKPGEACVLAKDVFYLSVPNSACPNVKLATDGSLDREYKYSRQPGNLDREDTKNVPLTAEMLPAPSARLLRERLQSVWRRLQAER